MQHKRVRISARLGDKKRHVVPHQTADEVNIAAQAIELRDNDRAFRIQGLPERSGEFGASIKGVSALTGLDLDMLGDDFDPFRFGKPGYRGALGLDPEAGSALPLRRNPIVSNRLCHAAAPFDRRTHIYRQL